MGAERGAEGGGWRDGGTRPDPDTGSGATLPSATGPGEKWPSGTRRWSSGGLLVVFWWCSGGLLVVFSTTDFHVR